MRKSKTMSNLSNFALTLLDRHSSPSPLLLNRLRPVAPKLSMVSSVNHFSTSSLGGTRWNPAPEQIRRLEELYRAGMRTPDARQIEKITSELAEHGRIEGKNVFYWFQNHKARERQKQKRGGSPAPAALKGEGEEEEEEIAGGGHGSCKRRCRRWRAEAEAEDGGGDGRTLELFPLHPDNNV